MRSFGSVVVDAGTRLRIRYMLYRAAVPVSNTLVVLHHGICHSRKQFRRLIAQLNKLGLHVVIIDQQSERSLLRNCIGVRAYVTGTKAAIEQIEAESGLRVGSYALHSMGALIGEVMQEQNEALRRPTVMLAPIPMGGAFPVSLRLFRERPLAFICAVITFNIRSLASSPEHTRDIFFDEDTPQKLVDQTTQQLKHAPFWMYIQLVFRPLLCPKIHNNGNKQLLIVSQTDRIFELTEYEDTIRFYEPGQYLFQRGGHDFFIEFAEETAERIAAFHHANDQGAPVAAPHYEIQPAGMQPTEKQEVAARQNVAKSSVLGRAILAIFAFFLGRWL